MKNLHLVVGALILFLVGGCNQEPVHEQSIEQYFSESFGDLDIETLAALETPYESIFGNQPNARSKGGFADIAEILDKLDEVFPDADVLEIESKIKRGLEVWEIKIVMSGGGILKILVVKELGEILKIKGITGPYDYEVNPGGSFISFSDAMQIALDEVGGEVAKWSLELEEEDKWEYEFHIVTDTRRFEVEIDAFTGEVLSIKEKDEGDDEDNDGDEEGDDEDKDEDENTPPPDEVAAFVLELFPGEIKHSEREEEHDIVTWVIFVVNEAGSVVKFIVKEEPLGLIRMASKRDPFDYDIDPGMELITLNAAYEIALNAIDAENKLVRWKLRMEHERWTYEFHLKTETRHFKIEINAHTGEVIFKEKTENHDEKDHDYTSPPESVAEFVLGLFPGEIKHSEIEDEYDFLAWKIYVVNEEGSAVKFIVREDPIELLHMEGEHGPFGYNIEPGNDIISFEQAKEIVFTEAEGNIKEWELKYTSIDDGHLWVYEFKIEHENVKYYIELNAISGEIIKFEVHD